LVLLLFEPLALLTSTSAVAVPVPNVPKGVVILTAIFLSIKVFCVDNIAVQSPLLSIVFNNSN